VIIDFRLKIRIPSLPPHR